MLPKKYHAIIFICILVMLLLLGLHLLGIGYSGGQAVAKSAALARNSSQASSSSNINTALSQNQVYRHPIVYDKLTGTTNNRINDVLGSKQPLVGDYPIDHYQQQLPNSQQPIPSQFNQLAQDDFFSQMHRPPPPPSPVGNGFSPPPMHAMHQPHHMHQSPQIVQQPPPPPPPMARQHLGLPLMAHPNQQPAPHGNNRQPLQDQMQSPTAADSLPSASSVNNNGAQRPNVSQASQQPQQQQQLAQLVQQQQQQYQQPLYYTPPIFAYNNFDNQNRPLNDPLNPYNYAVPPNQIARQQQVPPLGVPEVPMSPDEFNARQARLRQLQASQQLQPTVANEVQPQNDRYGKSQGHQAFGNQPNLLADPQQQQRHKQQMLDRQLLLGNAPLSHEPLSNQSSLYPNQGFRQPASITSGPQTRAPPYAHNMVSMADVEPQFGAKQQLSAQNRILPSNSRMESPTNGKLLAPSLQPTSNKLTSNAAATASHLSVSGDSQAPMCARQDQLAAMEMANSSTQMPLLFCNEDPEYPTKEIMRALELYASERSIEQLLPQLLIQMQSTQRPPESPAPGGSNGGRTSSALVDIQRQLILDSLQPSISVLKPDLVPATMQTGQQVEPPNLFPSANYEPMCRSVTYMAQPRRARNLLGQWKVVVNLPGHKYRGIAISQMVRVDECTRPNGECNSPTTTSRSLMVPTTPRSRCLQHYENQRLVAWSHQQGLHVDIFRVPIACSCHIRR